MKSFLLKFLHINPSFILVAGLLNGIFPILLFPSIHVFLVVLYLILSSSLLLLVSRKQTVKFFLIALVGLVSVLYAIKPSGNDYNKLLIANKQHCGAEIKARIIDATVPGKDIYWLPLPNMVKAEVINFRYSETDSWQTVSGRTFLRFPYNSKDIAYGEVLTLSGYFAVPEETLAHHGFRFENYLKSHGIYTYFVVADFAKATKPAPAFVPGIRLKQGILYCRDILLNGMTRGMETRYKKMLAAIIFGFRQGLNYDSRRQFKQSGVIHIFAISGLHVGILALTLYLLFCWVPFRSRHVIIPVFLLLYVLTTGLQASAVRAFLMISIWSLHRASLKSISPLNSVFLAACLVLLWNPLACLGTGFQYSFIIAGFLILSWQSAKKWLDCINETNLWDPDYGSDWKLYWHRFRNTSLNSLFSSFVAWGAGTGLNLLYGNLFIPGAILANFFILPFVWLLFIVAACEVVLFPLRHILHIVFLLQGLLKTINCFSLVGATWGGGLHLATPPGWLLVSFFMGLLLLVTAREKKFFLLAAGILVGNVVFWYFPPFSGKDRGELKILHGNASQIPAFVYIPPSKTGVTIINIGSPERAKAIVGYLNSRGINLVDTLYFSRNVKETCDGAWVLFSGIDVRQTVFPDKYRISEYAKLAMRAAAKNGVDIRLRPPLNDTSSEIQESFFQPGLYFQQKRQNELNFGFDYPNCQIQAQVRETQPGEKEIIIQNGGQKKIELLRNTNKLNWY